VVSVAKTGLLVPQNTIRIELPTDTTLLEREVILPYRQINVPNILADANTNIFVVNRSGYNNSRTTGALFYKTASQTQFTQVAMIAVGDTIRATIPAQFSTEEITFYTSITDSSRNNTYLSRQRSIVPLASGILTNIRVTPAISGQTLRVGEIYKLELFVRDGINKSLGDRFEGEEATGSVNWTNLTDTTGLALLAQEGTTVTLVAQKTGTYSIQVSADLDGSQLNQKINLQVTNIPLKNITVSSPAKQVANSNAHLFAYSAVDTSGNSVLLGSSLKWQVEPQISGSIDNRGLFSPSGSSILGTFVVSARDSVSELIGYSDAVELIARIEPDEEYLLMNGDGLELQLQQGSVDIPSQVSLAETKPADTKKFVFAQGTENSYTVGDRVYVLSFSGSELKKPAQLTLPEDTTISELNTGERQIARFNFVTLQWELLSNTLGKSFGNAHSGTVTTAQLGQFAVLAANEPLGIRYAAILPSPFSPDIAPVKIGYWLDTAFPPARVTIKIYNIRGELVRTLMEDKLQQPGRYGSSSSDLEITWNGLTDAGNMARNGRYLVQIVAKDQQTEVVELLQVVLIK
jgi:flagellar hook assembly protein FlgD